jgi:hypothetical protein
MFGEHAPPRRNTRSGMERPHVVFAFMFAEHLATERNAPDVFASMFGEQHVVTRRTTAP